MQKKSAEIIKSLISKYESTRAFSETIGEDPSNVRRWAIGKYHPTLRAVITICRMFRKVKPQDLYPSLPSDLSFKFKRED